MLLTTPLYMVHPGRMGNQTMPTVSVVMLSYNRKAELRLALERNLAEHPPFAFEVIVVEITPPATARRKRRCAAKFPEVRLDHPGGKHRRGGRQPRFRHCRRKVRLILDHDRVEPSPAW